MILNGPACRLECLKVERGGIGVPKLLNDFVGAFEVNGGALILLEVFAKLKISEQLREKIGAQFGEGIMIALKDKTIEQ
jgi:hypothetical protein